MLPICWDKFGLDEKGIVEEEIKGKIDGKNQTQKENVINFYIAGEPIVVISENTGLSIGEVNLILKNKIVEIFS
jgi:hypothetical protein